MTVIVIANGSVLTPEGWMQTDVAVSGAVIVEIDQVLESATVIDAAGCLVGPGFVDLHTHLREPGQTWKEDVASGSLSAAAGGFTAVVAMPNTDPPIDSPKVVDLVASRGVEVGLVDVIPSGALTVGRSGHAVSDIAALYRAGVRVFSDDGDSVEDSGLLAEIMSTMAALDGAVVAQHAEVSSLTDDGHMHDGAVSRRLGIGGLAAEAESEIVRRDLDLVRRTGARYHCQHVSAESTVEAIRSAKEEGLPVTAEVTPHHLSFTEEDLLSLDTNFKMYPPLRSESDRNVLLEALREGIIDVVATDHAPHLPSEKDVAFPEAPRGVIGLETAASVVWGALAEPDALFKVLSTSPAGIAGLSDHGQAVKPGNKANLVVFAPEEVWNVTSFQSKSANSPYLGADMTGRVRTTIHDGRVSYQSGEK